MISSNVLPLLLRFLFYVSHLSLPISLSALQPLNHTYSWPSQQRLPDVIISSIDTLFFLGLPAILHSSSGITSDSDRVSHLTHLRFS